MRPQAAKKSSAYLSAIRHLPEGGTLTIPDVTWSEYEEVLAALGDHPSARINYLNGGLWVMSPMFAHGLYAELLQNLALLYADKFGLDFETGGPATFQEQSFPAGAEPDTCFYVAHAAQIIGKRRLDMRQDPPPDMIVEIDLSHSSEYKFDFYAHLGVPEIWRYDETRLAILVLQESQYEEAEYSRAFPRLPGSILTLCLALSQTAGQNAARQRFRRWLRTQSKGER